MGNNKPGMIEQITERDNLETFFNDRRAGDNYVLTHAEAMGLINRMINLINDLRTAENNKQNKL